MKPERIQGIDTDDESQNKAASIKAGEWTFKLWKWTITVTVAIGGPQAD